MNLPILKSREEGYQIINSICIPEKSTLLAKGSVVGANVGFVYFIEQDETAIFTIVEFEDHQCLMHPEYYSYLESTGD